MNNSIGNINKDESGVGFVESLVAIAIGGIACIALFSVATTVIREANYNEIRDAMNMYAIEGMDIVRSSAARSFSTFPQCDTGNPTKDIEAYIVSGNPPSVIALDPALDAPCSVDGAAAGKCERLSMPKATDDFFYREVTVRGAGDNPVVGGVCTSMQVEVSVGLLMNAGESDPPRGNISEKTIVGYVFK